MKQRKCQKARWTFPSLMSSFLLIGSLLGCDSLSRSPSERELGSSGGGVQSSEKGIEGSIPEGLPEGKFVVFEVPKMACQHACWPEVKKTLENQAGVANVKLAPQPNEDEVVDKKVYVTFEGAFDTVAAIAALDRVGFEDSTVVPRKGK